MRILILGGTTEAASLSAALAGNPDCQPILSLAGRTRTPALSPIPARRGGFGGAPGLAQYLRAEAIDALVDATHPFARIISANAFAAAAETATPRLALTRPEWQPEPGDRWTILPAMEDAPAALGPIPRRVFLTIGQQELGPFRAAPHHHYLIRSVEPPDPASLPPNTTCIAARGPFNEDDERRLLQEGRIEILVTKNSGAAATAAKLAAARALGLPVLVIARPPPPPPPWAATVAEALAWLQGLGRRATRPHRPEAPSRHQTARRGV